MSNKLTEQPQITTQPSSFAVISSSAVKLLTWAGFTALLDALYVVAARSISGGGLVTGGGDLSTNRTLTVTAATNEQGEEGVATNVAMTPASTAAAIAALAPEPDLSAYALIGTAPTALDDLGKIAGSLNNDADFHGSMVSALTLKANAANAALTGTPTAPTATPGTNSTQIATTAYADAAAAAAAAALVDGAPSTLNTLNELAAALNDDASAAATLTTAIGDVAADLTAHEALTNNPHGVTKSQVGLSNVDNTSDVNKPISTATQTALDTKAAASHTHAQSEVTDLVEALAAKAPLASPALTGTPTAPTPAVTDDSTLLATTAFVNDANDVRAARAGYNVKDYGAKGDSRKVTDGVSTNASTTVTSASNPWTAADVGKVIWGVNTATKALAVPLGTIATYVGAGEITVSSAATASATGLHLVWGTEDTDNIQAAAAAAKAAFPRGLVIVPAGGYIFDELLFDLTETTAGKAGGVMGQGTGQTIFYPSPAHDLAASAMLVKSNGNCYDTTIGGFSVEGSYYQWSASGKHVIEMAGFIHESLRDVRIDYLYGTTSGISLTGYFQKLERCYVESLGYIGISISGAGSAWLSECIAANCGLYSIAVDGVTGTANQKSHVRIVGGWIDESNNGSLDINGSTDVVLEGVRINGPQSYAGLIVRGNSNVRAVGCELLPWGTSGNRPGVDVASGSTLWLSNCRVDSSGTSHSLTNAGTVYLSATRVGVSGSGTGIVNTGTVIDGGANSVVSRSGAGTTRMAPIGWIDGPTGATMVIAPASGQNLQFYPTGGGNITYSGPSQFNSAASYADSVNLIFGTSTGTKIGTGTTQKMGFWNATPVVQQTLSTGTGATVDQVITLLQTLGLCKQ
jgi:hypothetical protein